MTIMYRVFYDSIDAIEVERTTAHYAFPPKGRKVKLVSTTGRLFATFEEAVEKILERRRRDVESARRELSDAVANLEAAERWKVTVQPPAPGTGFLNGLRCPSPGAPSLP